MFNLSATYWDPKTTFDVAIFNEDYGFIFHNIEVGQVDLHSIDSFSGQTLLGAFHQLRCK